MSGTSTGWDAGTHLQRTARLSEQVDSHFREVLSSVTDVFACSRGVSTALSTAAQPSGSGGRTPTEAELAVVVSLDRMAVLTQANDVLQQRFSHVIAGLGAERSDAASGLLGSHLGECGELLSDVQAGIIDVSGSLALELALLEAEGDRTMARLAADSTDGAHLAREDAEELRATVHVAIARAQGALPGIALLSAITLTCCELAALSGEMGGAGPTADDAFTQVAGMMRDSYTMAGERTAHERYCGYSTEPRVAKARFESTTNALEFLGGDHAND